MYNLPQPSTKELTRSNNLLQVIFQTINNSPTKMIPFDDYVELCLYHHEFGYYTNGDNIGSGGDFITAPEISVLFSQTIVRYIEPFLSDCSTVIEYGAGRGTMAKDILEATTLITKYYIIETSPALKLEQQQTLKGFENVIWINQTPDDFDGVVLLNEVLDAISFKRWVFDDNIFKECNVSYNNNKLQLTKSSLTMSPPCDIYDDYATGYQTETRPRLSDFVKKINGSTVIYIDYALDDRHYFHPRRIDGTMNCYFKHHMFSDAFVYPGLVDITAHVHIDDLIMSCKQNNYKLYGLETQANFLINNGILEIAQDVFNSTDDLVTQAKLSKEIQKLTLPTEMGEQIKVITFTKSP